MVGRTETVSLSVKRLSRSRVVERFGCNDGA